MQNTEQERVPMDDSAFKIFVVDALTKTAETVGELKADMHLLLGNGSPGEIGKLKNRLRLLEYYAALIAGGSVIAGFIFGHSWHALVSIFGQ